MFLFLKPQFDSELDVSTSYVQTDHPYHQRGSRPPPTPPSSHTRRSHVERLSRTGTQSGSTNKSDTTGHPTPNRQLTQTSVWGWRRDQITRPSTTV